MRAPEVHPVASLKLGRYAVAGIMALALSLAGVMGGHQLLGAAFGTGDSDEALAVPAAEGSGCPPALQAADACDYDGDLALPDDKEEACDSVPKQGIPATPSRGVASGALGGGR